MKLMIMFAAIWALIQFTGCSAIPVKIVKEEPVVVEPEICGDGKWCYDEVVRGGLTPALRAAQPGVLCPKGSANFWPALVKATAYRESSWKVRTDYTERFPDSSGVRQVSRGLMQLSYDDEGRGPHCKNLRVSIYDPKTNLLCAVEIMDQLVRQNKKPSLRENLGRYWSTIRDAKVDGLLKTYVPECFQ